MPPEPPPSFARKERPRHRCPSLTGHVVVVAVVSQCQRLPDVASIMESTTSSAPSPSGCRWTAVSGLRSIEPGETAWV
jgi:hypothetical protein